MSIVFQKKFLLISHKPCYIIGIDKQRRIDRMMVSTRGRYALRVMIDLAEHQTTGYIPLKEVAERQDISEKYLENIIKSLVRDGFLAGVRGKGGGYRLTRSPDSYTVGSILRLIEGSLAPVTCLEQNPVRCERASKCRTLPMWQELDRRINEYLDGITVADLMDTGGDGDDYVI
jgi:Rrf2 family protein